MVSKLASYTNVAQTDLGQVEYYREGNINAPQVMLIHGQMGGWDMCLEPLIKQHWLNAGYGIICPSRAGYLRSELRDLPLSAQQQADTFALMLDRLVVDQVVVVGGSAGGPSAYAFAAKYPARTLVLINMVAISGPKPEEQGSPLCCIDDKGNFPLSARVFSAAITTPLASYLIYQGMEDVQATVTSSLVQMTTMTAEERAEESERILANETLTRCLQNLARDGAVPFGPRWPGNLNDIIDQSTLDLPLERIKVPTMVIHDGHAGANGVGLENAERAKKLIPSSSLKEYIVAESAWHIIWLAPEWGDLAAKQVRFVKENFPDVESQDPSSRSVSEV